ncbi:MAG: DUF362 domain-containing protein [Deltaproteobacteria bacterium]|nr:DUF362 domain-containing protein [Deltaproteobacteria bacterium]
MHKSKVAVIKTKPETIFEDIKKVMELADYEKYLVKEADIALKINISWHIFYPACSTTPWQLEGVIKTLLNGGYEKDKIYGAHNRTVVVSAKKGEINNKHKKVLEKYGVKNIHLYENEEWITYNPKGKMLALDKIFTDGIQIPKRLIGDNIIHLPTLKTHVFTTMTGAMKNAFGGLLHEKRHWTHSVIHETLVDLLTIQKEIHPGIFAVMDGTFAGDGPGPRCMEIHEADILLASADQVAIDAVAAKIMGFEPMELPFIRISHEAGLGVGEINEIDIVGEDISDINLHFTKGKNTFASKGQKMIYWGPLKFAEKLLLRSFITPWSYLASIIYHDWYWYPFIGKKRVKEALKTKWGKLFLSY